MTAQAVLSDEAGFSISQQPGTLKYQVSALTLVKSY